MAVAAAIGAVTMDRGVFVAFVLAIAGAALVGVLNGTLIASLRVQPIVVTLATLIGGRGLAQIISRNGELVTVGDPTFLALGRGYVGPIPIQVLIATGVVAASVFVLRATRRAATCLPSEGIRAQLVWPAFPCAKRWSRSMRRAPASRQLLG